MIIYKRQFNRLLHNIRNLLSIRYNILRFVKTGSFYTEIHKLQFNSLIFATKF